MAKRKYGDGSVFERKDGRWEGRLVVGYKENGYAKTKSVTAPTKTECEEKLKKLREEVGRRSERIKPDMPFGDWLDFWYQNFSKPKLRPTTQACYEGRIYTHIIPQIGQIPLCKLTQNELQSSTHASKRVVASGSWSNSEKDYPIERCAPATPPAEPHWKRQ